MKRALLALLIGASPVICDWKAGAARVNITPQEPIWLAGYGARTKPSEGVLHEIYVKALALQHDDSAPAVLVTSDLLGFTREMADTVAEAAAKKYGLSRDRLVLNASHTHSAPVTGQLLRPAYPLDDAHAVVIRRYTEALLDRVVGVIGAALRDVAPAQLAFEQGLAGFAVNRRRVSLRHLPGPVDHDVPVLSVRAPDHRLLAVVFGYACHATVLSDYLVNGDWPGFAQETIEKQHPGVMALFVAGCGADANPLPRRSVELARTYGKVLALAVDEVLNRKMRPVSGPLTSVLESVDIPFQKPPSREEFQKRLQEPDASRRRHARYMLDRLARDGRLPDRYPYPVQLWQFGRDLTFLALAGEVVVDYALRFKSQYGWNDTWVAGYSNDVFAYIPSLRVLREGGYEGGGAMIGYGQPGPFGAAVEEIIAEKVDELVRRARPMRDP
jgi:hypothetical protein